MPNVIAVKEKINDIIKNRVRIILECEQNEIGLSSGSTQF